MSMENIFGIAGSALNAQLVRLNLTASNLANANTATSSQAETFKAKKPVFQSILESQKNEVSGQFAGGVKISKIIDDTYRRQRTCAYDQRSGFGSGG